MEDKRPSTCEPRDSGQERCESQLHGAIIFMHQEFGTPSGEFAEMTVDDARNLWLEAKYPLGFLARSPRSCADASDPTASGCQQCLNEVPSMIDPTSVEAQRFCRCLASKQLTTHQLDAIQAHRDLQCPRGPVVDSIVTVASVGRRSRALQQADDEQALRGILADFYASLGLEYHDADVLIRPLSAGRYSIRLAASKENAIYLAHSVRSVLPTFVPGTPGPTPLRLTSVSVSDDIRLQSNCGQFCEASGSFLEGIPPPPPPPPAAPPGTEPCFNPCLQSTCLNVSTFGTCDQLASIGCSCSGCCTNPPSPPPPSPSSPPPSPSPPPPHSPPPPSTPTCATPIDFVLVLDESGSMKKPKPHGSMDGPGGLKAFAKTLVSQYALGEDRTRFAVVSFAADATTRVPWSHNATGINAGIDQISADGQTSISDGFEAARQLFANNSRAGATKVVLLVSDGEQTVDAAPGKTPEQTAIDAASRVKGDGATVFAWGFGNKVGNTTMQQIATDPSKAIFARNLAELTNYLDWLKVAIYLNNH